MKVSPLAAAGVAGATALVAAFLVGCSNSKSSTATSASATTTTSSSTPPTAQAQSADYSALLIKATDITAPEVFTAAAPIQNPNGQPGVATTFSNPDSTHVIRDSILILANPAAAARALDSAKSAPGGSVTGTPVPADVGTGGTTVTGNSSDGSKGVTTLLFTEGSAFIRLEFDGPVNALAPQDFVTDVGQKQGAAVKQGPPA